MTRNILTILLLTIFGQGQCQQDTLPKWKTTDWAWDSVKYDTIILDQITFEGMPIVTSLDSLLLKLGDPDTTWERGGRFFSEETTRTKKRPDLYKDAIAYKAYFYENLRFAVWDNKVQLNEIEFITSDLELKTPKFILSRETMFDDMKTILPNSFEWRNMGITNLTIGYKGITEEDFKRNRVSWLYVHNGLGENNWLIELTFIDKKLAYAFFNNFE